MEVPPIGTENTLDEIGYWSEVKLEILRKYATAYSTILASQPYLHHVYIDAFAGRGIHIARRTGEVVAGSPLNALAVEPPFEAYYFMDLDTDKIEALKSAIGDRPDIHVLPGDSNELLLSTVFPTLTWESYNRALCFLDPYGLQVRWDVVAQAGGAADGGHLPQLFGPGHEQERPLARCGARNAEEGLPARPVLGRLLLARHRLQDRHQPLRRAGKDRQRDYGSGIC